MRSKQEALRNQQEVAHTKQIATLKQEHETSLAGHFTALIKRPIVYPFVKCTVFWFNLSVIFFSFSRAQEDS